MSPSIESQTLNGNVHVSQTNTVNGNANANGNGTVNGNANANGNGTVNGNGQAKTATDVKDLKDRLFVERSEKAFGSRAVSLIDLPAGSLFLKITLATPSTKAYSSVQTGPDSHIELNSDIVFINHSCNPSVVFDMEKMEVRVSRERDLKKGEALTFFYPSSEWDMAQPFSCTCGESECKGVIDGAGKMDEGVVRGYWLNKHIESMLDERTRDKSESA
ncbi:hypothetical protein E2P81_ATG05572 [Venturia nashicola]|nr:hypothetical protein E2P81_ATG05572 [Venturia nashicola]